MIPVYSNEPFSEITSRAFETEWVPTQYVVLDGGRFVTGRTEDKWFCRLSAPGYMDCTDWCGPFDSLEEGGIIQDMIVPAGVKVLVRDYDIEGIEQERLVKGPDGNECTEETWTGDSIDSTLAAIQEAVK